MAYEHIQAEGMGTEGGSGGGGAGDVISAGVDAILGLIGAGQQIGSMREQQRALARQREASVSALLEGVEYDRMNQQMLEQERLAQGQATQAVNQAIRAEEKAIEGAIVGQREEALRQELAARGLTYGVGRDTSSTVMWVVGLGGLALVLGGVYFVAKRRG